MNVMDRVKNILLKPKEEWEVISQETTKTADLYKNYIVYLAAIGPIASFIGLSVVGVSMPFGQSFRVPFAAGLSSAIVAYVLGLVGVYILALIIDYLANRFSGQKDMNQAMKLACYSYTAGWLSGIFTLIPYLAVLSILGLYSIYLLYTGIPVLMKAPREKSLAYTAAVIVVAIVISVIFSWVSRAFIPSPMTEAHMPKATSDSLQKSEKAVKQMQETLEKTGQMTKEQAQQLEAAAKKMQEEFMKQTTAGKGQ